VKDELWVILEEYKVKIQRGKYQLLPKKTTVKEVVRRALLSVPGLEQEEHEAVEDQVMKHVKAIQQLQARVTKLEIQAIQSTL
jgi:hypothetical protein